MDPDIKFTTAKTSRCCEGREAQTSEADLSLVLDELHNVTTLMYIIIETARNYQKYLSATLRELCTYRAERILTKIKTNLQPATREPRLVHYLMIVTAKLRWDDANELPQIRVIYLTQFTDNSH